MYNAVMVVAENIERKVEAANRSHIARVIGVKREHVSQILSRRSVPSLAVAAGIAREIGVTLDDFWGYLQTASVN